MKFILTQEEYDGLRGQCESIRAEYQKQLDTLAYGFTQDVQSLVDGYFGGREKTSAAFKYNDAADALIKAWQAALAKLKIKLAEQQPQ